MPAPPINVADASVVLGSSRILDDISLRVAEGQSVALMGMNGSGKSTLVRAILGIVPVASGSIQLYGADVAHRGAVPWGRLGYVPQRVSAASGVPATAVEVVRTGLLGTRRNWASFGRASRAKAMRALEKVGLADRADDHVQVFSGGQSQRVLIARALVREPDLLILDEPLAGIDKDSRRALAEILGELRGEGVTLVTVLHEMGELRELVDRAIVLADGAIVHDGDVPAPAPGHDHPDHDHIHPHEASEAAYLAPTLRTDAP
ncbi:MAG: metal ABC transporter ATP-binding protein [Actinomycetaceae bacterium]|nr:metal ABC transporter ATP-binding protein [Actinomycetaceae bacterium]